MACGVSTPPAGRSTATPTLTPDRPGRSVEWPARAASAAPQTRRALAAAVSRYQSAFEDMLHRPGDPAALAAATALTTAEQAQRVHASAEHLRRHRLHAVGRVHPRPVVLAVTPDRADVAFCAPQNQIRIRHSDTGGPADHANTGVAISRFTLERHRSGWRVASVEPLTADRCPPVLPISAARQLDQGVPHR